MYCKESKLERIERVIKLQKKDIISNMHIQSELKLEKQNWRFFYQFFYLQYLSFDIFLDSSKQS